MTTLARVTLGATNGVPADAVVNTFNFGAVAAPKIADPTGHAQSLVDFYNAPAAANGDQLADFLGDSMSRATNACKIDFYDRNDPPGTPAYASFNFTLAANPGSIADLPGEVAVAVSWLAEPVAGIKSGRLRGRTFVGRLNVLAQSDAGGGIMRPSQNLRESIQATSGALIDTRPDFVIYSRASVPNAAHLITHGYVDDAFDTIRSRGQAATTRYAF